MVRKNKDSFGITPTQIEGYTKVKWDVSKNEILTKFNFGTTVYHTRLTMLSTLFINGGDNIPYFTEDILYKNNYSIPTWEVIQN